MTAETRNAVLSSAENGIITARTITELGIHRHALQELVSNGEIIQCSRGIYMVADEFEDEYLILQRKYSKGIFSHGTALYLHGYSERVPLTFNMTFPSNYNSQSLKAENVIVTRVILENYGMGIIKITTPFGNPVNCYDLERSLCDMLRGSENDIQTIQFAMKKYVSSKEKDINKLMAYAAKLRVESKVRNYMEVLL